MVENSLSALTAIAAPAVLTNASSILALGMGNRLARVVDRTRALLSELEDPAIAGPRWGLVLGELGDLRRRAQLLLSAQRCFFTSLGSFAISALLSVLAFMLSPTFGSTTVIVASVLALSAGATGVLGLAWGCWSMVIETQVAIRSLSTEAASIDAGDHTARGAVRRGVVICLVSLSSFDSICAAAQEATPSVVVAPDNRISNVWALAGVNAALADRWRTLVMFGHLGGADSRLLMADLTFDASNTLQLLVGYVHVNPTTRASHDVNLPRAGVIWRPFRGRFVLENRALIELRSGHGAPISPRLRDRFRISWLASGPLRLRGFASVEGFAVVRSYSARRYQLGVTRSMGVVTVDVYWLRHVPRAGTSFNNVGLTALWAVGRT